MKLTTAHEWSGVMYDVEYEDADSFDHLPQDRCSQCYGVCLFKGQLVIVYGGKSIQHWGLVGGSVEKGETLEQTLRRELREESNMEILSYVPIGYQKITNRADGRIFYQLRYACTVRPFGAFVADPDNSIIEMKLIDPKDYKQYFDWGEIGDRIIQHGLELLQNK